MPAIVATTEINRSAAEVFAYATDPTLFSEWQTGVVSGCMVSSGVPAVGTHCRTTRRIGGADPGVPAEEYDVVPQRRDLASRSGTGAAGPVLAVNVHTPVEQPPHLLRSPVFTVRKHETLSIRCIAVKLVLVRHTPQVVTRVESSFEKQFQTFFFF